MIILQGAKIEIGDGKKNQMAMKSGVLMKAKTKSKIVVLQIIRLISCTLLENGKIPYLFPIHHDT